MQLNSLTYVVFFCVVYVLYRVTPHRFRNVLLLGASYVFYAWWDWRFLFLVILSTVVNYCCGQIISGGAIRLQQRLLLSFWVVLTCFVSVCVQWQHFPALWNDVGSGVYLYALWGPSAVTLVFPLTVMVVLTANLFYPKLLRLSEARKRALMVFIGVAVNLIILGFFKYCNFFLENVATVLGGLGFNASRLHLDIVLPIGVSFYTFRGISYVVDAHRRQIDAPQSFVDFSLYMAFFPAILAGPIDRAGFFLRQIVRRREFSLAQTFRGLHLFVYGLFKKVVIADGVVRSVVSVFDSTGRAGALDVIAATLLFTIQIYCDFSGYTDMARGTAKFFGIDLTLNFRLPYFSKNPREFWNRWHISLSTWLRDYLYIPLGGNRQGRARTYRNLIVTMVLGGLWHGAAWNFALWGLYHGIALACHRALTGIRAHAQRTESLLCAAGKVAACFIMVAYGWLLFRAPSLERLWELTSALFVNVGGFEMGLTRPRLAAVIGLPLLCIVEFVEKKGAEAPFYRKLPLPLWTALYAAIVFSIAIGLTNDSTQFIYMVF